MDIERFNKKKNNIKNLIETLYKNVSINIAGAVEELEEIAIGNLEFYNCELETNKKLKKELDEIKSLYNSKIGEIVLRQDKLDTLNKGIDELIKQCENEILEYEKFFKPNSKIHQLIFSEDEYYATINFRNKLKKLKGE